MPRALLGFAAVRALGLVVLAVEARSRHRALGHVLFNRDSGWHLTVARFGYDHDVVATDPLHTAHSDLAYRPAAHLRGQRAGVTAALLWGMFPVAVVENMAYAESLFTAFAVWSLYAAVTRRMPAIALGDRSYFAGVAALALVPLPPELRSIPLTGSSATITPS